jgi:hypothetical protein
MRALRQSGVVLALLGLLFAAACGSSSTSSSSSSTATASTASTADLNGLLIEASDLGLTGFTRGPVQPAAPGLPGVAATYASADHAKNIQIQVVRLPDAPTAKQTYDQAVQGVKSALPTATVRDFPAGDAATRFDLAQNANVNGQTTSTVVVLVGRYVAVLVFASPPTDPVPDDILNGVVQKQVAKLKAA